MKTIKQIAQNLKQAISDTEQKLALDLFREAGGTHLI